MVDGRRIGFHETRFLLLEIVNISQIVTFILILIPVLIITPITSLFKHRFFYFKFILCNLKGSQRRHICNSNSIHNFYEPVLFIVSQILHEWTAQIFN